MRNYGQKIQEDLHLSLRPNQFTVSKGVRPGGAGYDGPLTAPSYGLSVYLQRGHHFERGLHGYGDAGCSRYQ